LGNVRLSYSRNATSGSAEALEENNYYPFGLKHEGYNSMIGNFSYQYKYNGKELQTDSGMYDYGARFYMSDIGRWGVVDPLAETSRRWSTYTYAYNNPIMFVDPDGRQNTDWYQKQKDGTYKNIKKSTDLVILDEKGKKVPTFTSSGPLGGYNEDYAEGVNEARNQGVISQSDAKEASNIATIYGIEKGGEGTAGAILAGEGLYNILKNPKGAWEALKSIKSLFSSSEQGFTVNPTKFDYFFGKVTTGSEHNITRSAQNLKDLTTLGIKNESQLTKIFGNALENGTVVSTKTSQYGTTVTKSINVGNKGAINVSFFYEGGNMSATPSVSTLIPKIAR